MVAVVVWGLDFRGNPLAGFSHLLWSESRIHRGSPHAKKNANEHEREEAEQYGRRAGLGKKGGKLVELAERDDCRRREERWR